MGDHSSNGWRTNHRSKAFFTTALIVALLLIFAPMAWPESAPEVDAGPAAMRTALLAPVAPVESVAPVVYAQVEPLPEVTVVATDNTATEALDHAVGLWRLRRR